VNMQGRQIPGRVMSQILTHMLRHQLSVLYISAVGLYQARIGEDVSSALILLKASSVWLLPQIQVFCLLSKSHKGFDDSAILRENFPS